MFDVGTWTGARGLVKHGYHTAAEVSGFSIAFDRQTTGGTVAAIVQTSDPYLLTQRPLVFVVPTKMGSARWPIESFTVAEDRWTARLGPLLQKD